MESVTQLPAGCLTPQTPPALMAAAREDGDSAEEPTWAAAGWHVKACWGAGLPWSRLWGRLGRGWPTPRRGTRSWPRKKTDISPMVWKSASNRYTALGRHRPYTVTSEGRVPRGMRNPIKKKKPQGISKMKSIQSLLSSSCRKPAWGMSEFSHEPKAPFKYFRKWNLEIHFNVSITRQNSNESQGFTFFCCLQCQYSSSRLAVSGMFQNLWMQLLGLNFCTHLAGWQLFIDWDRHI